MVEWNRQDALGLKMDANDLHCFACSLLLCISFALRFGFDKWKCFNDKPVEFTKLAYTRWVKMWDEEESPGYMDI